MRSTSKGGILAAVTLLTVSLGTSPAQANTDITAAFAFTPPAGSAQANAQQTLVTVDSSLTSETLDALAEVTSVKATAAEHNFDVAKTIAAATAEIGTSRATGWGQPGECIMSANRWIKAGGGNWQSGGSPVTNYRNAVRLSIADAQPGDIIQYEFIASPHSWAAGVHTMLVTGVNDDGTLQIIESNNPGGSGLVSQNKHFTPNPPAGFQAVVWRF